LLLWLIVVLVPIVIVLCVASALHYQQLTTLATLKHTQGDGCVVLWLIVVLLPIVVVLCVVLALKTRAIRYVVSLD
jgi:hypothetical protein